MYNAEEEAGREAAQDRRGDGGCDEAASSESAAVI